MSEPTCPKCSKSDQIMGVEYREVYDGVATWWCTSCDYEWNRFPDDHYVTQRLNKYRLKEGKEE